MLGWKHLPSSILWRKTSEKLLCIYTHFASFLYFSFPNIYHVFVEEKLSNNYLQKNLVQMSSLKQAIHSGVPLRVLGFPFEPNGDGNFLLGIEARDIVSLNKARIRDGSSCLLEPHENPTSLIKKPTKNLVVAEYAWQ